MTTGDLDAARAALRVRQGAGARYDAPSAPARELAWARRGTAYFARLLNDIPDLELDGDSQIAGYTRRHVVAHVGYQARMLCRIIGAARKNLPVTDPPIDQDEHSALIAQGGTLPARALRHLVSHTEVHLNVEWRDLTDAAWDRPINDGRGRRISPRETAQIRAHAIWSAAIALNAGGVSRDIPADMIVAGQDHPAAPLVAMTLPHPIA